MGEGGRVFAPTKIQWELLAGFPPERQLVVSTATDPKLFHFHERIPLTTEEMAVMVRIPCREVAGRLMYLMVTTPPDIATVVLDNF